MQYFFLTSPHVAKEFLIRPGCCVLLSVFDHDRIGRDDFAGEVLVHLPSVPKVGMDRATDRLPVIIMPLRRPKKPSAGPFQVRL